MNTIIIILLDFVQKYILEYLVVKYSYYFVYIRNGL